MRIPIEDEPTGSITDWPAAEPGTYHMKVRRWSQDVETKYGTKDVIEFIGENAYDQTVGAKLWISGPRTGDDGKHRKGNLWQYRRLAQALGAEALVQYRTPLADGGSSFCPSDWKDRYVKVIVGLQGVDSIEEPDLEVVQRLTKPAPSATPTPGTKKTDVPDDDIPF